MNRMMTTPERLKLTATFDVATGKAVRLAKVDNLTSGTIDCYYLEENKANATAGYIYPSDEFTFPHSNLNAIVNVHVVDGAGNPVKTMDTRNAPPM